MEYYVDRLDAGLAVCSTADGEIRRFSVNELPDGIFEGCVLREENGAFFVDAARTEARKSELLALQDSLFDEETPAQDPA